MTEYPRLHGLSIDIPEADHARAVDFWSAALGVEAEYSETHPDFAQLIGATPGCYVLVQKIGDGEPHVHLDFATTQRDADADRLVGAGAAEITREFPWAVLNDPAGLPFCLCPAEGCE